MRKNKPVTRDTSTYGEKPNYLHFLTMYININNMTKDMFSLGAILLIMGLFVTFEAYAGPSGRGKVIAFDDDLVEGLNKRPLDSLQQLGGGNTRKKSHLYRKRGSYPTETKITLQEMGWM